MVISGGFADAVWDDFPVWAYDLSRSRRNRPGGGEGGGGGGDSDSDGPEPYWTDLTISPPFPPEVADNGYGEIIDDGGGGGDEATTSSSSSSAHADAHADASPRGRVGHLSSVHRGCLYVFGGFTYALGTFRVADDVPPSSSSSTDGGSNTLAIWRGCGLDDALLGGVGRRRGGRTRRTDDNSTNLKSKGKEEGAVEDDRGRSRLRWEMIVPRVVSTSPTRPDDDASVSGNGDDEDDLDGIGGRGMIIDEDGTHRHHGANDDGHRSRRTIAAINSNVGEAVDDPTYALPRGEARGGHYHPSDDDRGRGNDGEGRDERDDRDCFVFHGGMHNYPTPGASSSTGGGMTVLGDVWRYDYASETLTLLSPYPPLPWQVSRPWVY
jgi:hypothetical protein